MKRETRNRRFGFPIPRFRFPVPSFLPELLGLLRSNDASPGLIDAIVPRKELKAQLTSYLDFLTEAKSQPAAAS